MEKETIAKSITEKYNESKSFAQFLDSLTVREFRFVDEVMDEMEEGNYSLQRLFEDLPE